jgi:hypothetical protein
LNLDVGRNVSKNAHFEPSLRVLPHQIPHLEETTMNNEKKPSPLPMALFILLPILGVICFVLGGVR